MINDYRYARVKEIYDLLFEHFGPRHWWPGDTRLEIVVGAVLTQAVAWQNVKKAIDCLKQNKCLDYEALLNIDVDRLAELIRPALYHRQKAKKLKNLLGFIEEFYQGDLDLMLEQDWQVTRGQLLNVWGLGPETVDSILLYAGRHPVFVVDAYTRRIMFRQGLVQERVDYQGMQEFMTRYSPAGVQIYNEYHALLVGLGARYCKKSRPLCSKCPIKDTCVNSPDGQDNEIGR